MPRNFIVLKLCAGDDYFILRTYTHNMAESIYNQFHRRTFVNSRKFYLYIAQDLYIFDTRKQLGKSYYSYNGKWDAIWDGDNKTLLKSRKMHMYRRHVHCTRCVIRESLSTH